MNCRVTANVSSAAGCGGKAGGQGEKVLMYATILVVPSGSDLRSARVHLHKIMHNLGSKRYKLAHSGLAWKPGGATVCTWLGPDMHLDV